jgi:hypothetical protein
MREIMLKKYQLSVSNETDFAPKQCYLMPTQVKITTLSLIGRDRLKSYSSEITITFDDHEPRRGFYDRLLVYIQIDNSLFNDARVLYR